MTGCASFLPPARLDRLRRQRTRVAGKRLGMACRRRESHSQRLAVREMQQPELPRLGSMNIFQYGV
jgi:hypothetical protein